jgi:signal transduction histidine kinase
MFFWSFINLWEILISASILYFIYVFINKKDAPLKIKVIFLSLLFIFVFFIPTQLNLPNFIVSDCEAKQGPLIYYFRFLEALFSISIISYLVVKTIRIKKEEKNQTFYLMIGAIIFNILVSWVNIYGSVTEKWEVTQYSFFAMPIFIGVLSYLIIKYKAFDIKLLSAQALVTALVVLIGSQLFFIKTFTNQVLTGITLVLATSFGWMLIRSVKTEVQRKEELQVMTNRLAQANDQLRKLDNAKSEFISIASHQLRTPLTAIKGFISLLLEGSYGKVNPAHKEVLNKVYLSNERLIALVEDMLNLSRIESGRMEYNFEKVKMESVAQEVFDTFIIRSKEKGLKLDLKLPETPLPEAMTDKNKIREVVSNLVDNAIKYTIKGWVTMKLSQNEDKIIVAISDTGIGVPKEEMPYLFDKFSRGKDITRLNTGGTGLGLHVGKRMIEALHGSIWIESEGAGKGSTFYIEVPTKIEE